MSDARILLTVIGTEFSKLKRCKVLLAIPICSLIPVIVLVFAYLYKEDSLIIWNDYFIFAEMLINMVLGIGFFSFITGFIYSREYGENTINNLFSYPISRMQFFISKLLIMFLIISITIISSFIILVSLGLILKHEILTFDIFFYYARVYLFMIIMHFALVPISAFLSIHNKSIIPATILGIAAIVINLCIMNTPIDTLFPWSIPCAFSPHEDGSETINYPLGFIVLSANFLCGMLLSIKSINKDVH